MVNPVASDNLFEPETPRTSNEVPFRPVFETRADAVVVVSSSRIVMLAVPMSVPPGSPATVMVRSPSAELFPTAVTVTAHRALARRKTTWWPVVIMSASAGLTLKWVPSVAPEKVSVTVVSLAKDLLGRVFSTVTVETFSMMSIVAAASSSAIDAGFADSDRSGWLSSSSVMYTGNSDGGFGQSASGPVSIGSHVLPSGSRNAAMPAGKPQSRSMIRPDRSLPS